jgi:hypothetical protein
MQGKPACDCLVAQRCFCGTHMQVMVWALVRGSPPDIRGDSGVKKLLVFLRVHGIFLGHQHALWSQQHNGKVRLMDF